MEIQHLTLGGIWLVGYAKLLNQLLILKIQRNGGRCMTPILTELNHCKGDKREVT
jgi:hypothetical protein